MELYVFFSNASVTEQCLLAGADAVVVDWEVADKRQRQSLFNTQINRHDKGTLECALQLQPDKLICRVNGGDNINEDEIKLAIDSGVTDIMLPMIQQAKEVEKVLKIIKGRTRIIVMLETQEAIFNCKEIGQLPVDQVYIGLNDLAIARGESNIFLPMVDGTIDKVREGVSGPLGVGGLTHPDKGNPIPSYLLLNEMKRLNLDFTFLRRSFFNDIQTFGIQATLESIRENQKSPYIEEKTTEFHQLVKNISMPTI